MLNKEYDEMSKCFWIPIQSSGDFECVKNDRYENSKDYFFDCYCHYYEDDRGDFHCRNKEI